MVTRTLKPTKNNLIVGIAITDMHKIKLNIAGEAFDVLFDGEKVASPEFPDQPINYTASCGMKITQEMLVQICKNKVTPVEV